MIKNVCDFLRLSAAKYGDKTAFVDDTKDISYVEFQTLSDALASEILKFGLSKKPVLIILDKSIDALISFMGVAKSGNFYTLLDPKTPLAKVEQVISILKPSLIISQKNSKFDLSNLAQKTIFCEDFSKFDIDEDSLETAYARQIDSDLLYVFFTSGSTGVPKGVSISHKSVIDYTFFVCQTFDLDENEILANQAPLYFDNSILDIFSTLKAGATLHLIKNSKFAFPNEILEYLQKHKISMIFWVPSVLIYFANTKSLDKFELKSLKKVLFCGEIMPNKQLNVWRKSLQNAMFANLYGPTEITDVCAYFVVDREFGDDELLPIGKACNNTEILVFDENLSLVTKPFIKGELYVRGTCLSLGYYANKDKTDEVFVQNPLHHNYKDMVYKTGDVVSYNKYGELVCHGRKDSQIKYMGHRIELGEIETACNSHLEVLNSACIFKNDEIIIFYEASSKLDLKSFLKQKLLAYMLPHKYILVDKFKLNQNGKIDKKALYEYEI